MRPGTSSPRPQSAILVPVAAAEDLVGPWRSRSDSLAPAGVPAHVTLIVPWLPPAEIAADDIDALQECLSGVPAFDFRLTKVCWFGRRVIWAAPEPDQLFRSLTGKLAERFGTPPWENEFDEVVPHLTVAHTSGYVGDLETVEQEVRACLPVACRASEVWVMVGDGRHWSIEAKLALVEPKVHDAPSRDQSLSAGEANAPGRWSSPGRQRHGVRGAARG